MSRLLFFLPFLYLTCFAAPSPTELQVTYLRKILQQADHAYYNTHQSLMSDSAYDALRCQYDRLIREYPTLAHPAQPGSPPDVEKRVLHAHPVLSLQKAYSQSAVDAFIQKGGQQQLYCIEPKIDGLTVILRYQEGLLVQALTRGDGKSGMNITAEILAAGVVPAVLKNAPDQVVVRGEIFITFAAFNALNARREKAGQHPLKSPRNTAAGSLRLKDYAEIANRKLSIQIFDLIATNPMPTTHTEALALITAVGLPVVESKTVMAADIQAAVAELNQRRTAFPFQTDGIVLRIDGHTVFKDLGATAQYPRGAIARKYKEIPVETRLLHVTWSIGETGKLTPVAHFEPVELSGATLQKASLYNLDHLRALDLRIGDRIKVIRAGGSIPEVIGVCTEKRNGNETPIPDPSR